MRILGYVLLIAVLLMGGQAHAQTGDVHRITIAVAHYPTNLGAVPFHVGVAQGFFRDEGIELERILGGEGGGTTVRHVLTADVAIGDVSTAAALRAYLAGAPVRIFGSTKVNTSDVYYVTRPDAPFERPEELVNHSWSFTNPGSVTHMTVLLALENLGIDVSSINLVSSGGMGAGLTLLQQGVVDVAPLFEPPYSSIKDNYKTLFFLHDVLPKYQQTVLITSPQMVRQNPDLLRAFIRAYQRSIDWISANPAAAGEIYAAGAEMDVAAAQAAVETAVAAGMWNLTLDAEALNKAVAGMRLTGLLQPGMEIDWEDVLAQDFLPEHQRVDVSLLDRNK